jgi:hypothetical protein
MRKSIVPTVITLELFANAGLTPTIQGGTTAGRGSLEKYADTTSAVEPAQSLEDRRS